MADCPNVCWCGNVSESQTLYQHSCGLLTISRYTINVNLHQDFVASMHNHFLQVQTDRGPYPNHAREIGMSLKQQEAGHILQAKKFYKIGPWCWLLPGCMVA